MFVVDKVDVVSGKVGNGAIGGESLGVGGGIGAGVSDTGGGDVVSAKVGNGAIGGASLGAGGVIGAGVSEGGGGGAGGAGSVGSNCINVNCGYKGAG